MPAPKDPKKRAKWIKNLSTSLTGYKQTKKHRLKKTGKNHYNYKEKVPFICPVCGITKYYKPGKIKNKKYCSHKCATTGKNNPMFGKKRPVHKPDCQCSFCKAKRGEYKGKNNPWSNQDRNGRNNPAFVNGKIKRDNRWWIWNGKKRVLRSRYIAEQYLGRKLLKEEVIHHINENPSDDRPENLYLFPNRSEHARQHGWKITPILKSNLI